MVPIATDRYNTEQRILNVYNAFERNLHFETRHTVASVEKYMPNLHLIGPHLTWIY